MAIFLNLLLSESDQTLFTSKCKVTEKVNKIHVWQINDIFLLTTRLQSGLVMVAALVRDCRTVRVTDTCVTYH